MSGYLVVCSQVSPVMESCRLAALLPTNPASTASPAKCSCSSTWSLLLICRCRAGGCLRRDVRVPRRVLPGLARNGVLQVGRVVADQPGEHGFPGEVLLQLDLVASTDLQVPRGRVPA